jgi:hypothetical protein
MAAAFLLALMAAPSLAQEAPPSAASREALRFPGFPDAPPFEVVARRDDLFFYPCDQCHEFMEASDEVRELDAPHDVELEHGNGRMWCIQCHSMVDRNTLWTLLRVLYNCTHCHDPHSPSIQPRKPAPMPPVRSGLERQDGNTHEVRQIWERSADSRERGETGDH